MAENGQDIKDKEPQPNYQGVELWPNMAENGQDIKDKEPQPNYQGVKLWPKMVGY